MKKCFFILLLFFSSLYSVDHIRANQVLNQRKSPIPYRAEDFSHLIGMPGFSEKLLKMHFTLYQGYVKNTNYLLSELSRMIDEGKGKSYEFGALKRRLGWEFDGMKLHEYYFSNLGGSKPLNPQSELYKTLSDQYGDFETWKQDFIDTGTMRGIGWVILYRDPKSGRLANTWINEHDVGHLSGGSLLLVLDVWEHAYITQYGLNRAKYIEVFFNNIDWDEVNQRYEASVSAPAPKGEGF